MWVDLASFSADLRAFNERLLWQQAPPQQREPEKAFSKRTPDGSVLLRYGWRKRKRQKCTWGSWEERALRKQKWSRLWWQRGLVSWELLKEVLSVWQSCLNPFTQDTSSHHRGLISQNRRQRRWIYLHQESKQMLRRHKALLGHHGRLGLERRLWGSQRRHLILQRRKVRPSVGGWQI